MAGFKVGERYMEIYKKSHFIKGIFQRISLQVQNSDIEKGILMAASEDEYILKTFLHGYFSKTAANIFILEIFTHILHSLL